VPCLLTGGPAESGRIALQYRSVTRVGVS
jgi:hypothetical protein